MLNFKYFDPKTHIAYEEMPNGTYCSFSISSKDGNISVALISDSVKLPDLNDLIEVDEKLMEIYMNTLEYLKYIQPVD
jgi:hypothetical protein